MKTERTMQDRINSHESPTDADLVEIRKKVQAGGDFPVIPAAAVLWLIEEIEYRDDQVQHLERQFDILRKAVEGALQDFASEL